MGKTTGAGLITFGFVLGVVGAIMRFAVHVRTSGFNIHMAGVILLIVGIIAVVGGAILVAVGGRSRSVTEEYRQSTPSSDRRVEDHYDRTA
jgi:hypothetical protein